MKNKNAIKNKVGQEVLEVVRVLQFKSTWTLLTVSDMDSSGGSKRPRHFQD